MPNLKTLQAEFQDYLMHSDNHLIYPNIVPDERFSAQNRLKVYHDAYRIRLLEILRLDFPKTHMLMGDDAFDKAFFEYLLKHPSHHFSVRYFGSQFSDFLKTTAPYHEFPVLSEMALFEWTLSFTLDAADDQRLAANALNAFAPEQWGDLRFKFHPSVTCLHLHWDTPQLWQDIDLEKPQRNPLLHQTPVCWLFWRKDIVSKYQSCTQAEELMFASVKAGDNFAEICGKLLYTLSEDEIPLFAAQTLYKWINEQLISHIIN